MIEAVRHPADMLEVGPYWIIDNRWGMRGITEGGEAYQFMQAVERSRTLTPSGGAACRIVWKWPEFNQQGQAINDNPNYNEVKGYPSISYGNMPGHSGPDQYPAWEYVVRAPDGYALARRVRPFWQGEVPPRTLAARAASSSSCACGAMCVLQTAISSSEPRSMQGVVPHT